MKRFSIWCIAALLCCLGGCNGNLTADLEQCRQQNQELLTQLEQQQAEHAEQKTSQEKAYLKLFLTFTKLQAECTNTPINPELQIKMEQILNED